MTKYQIAGLVAFAAVLYGTIGYVVATSPQHDSPPHIVRDVSVPNVPARGPFYMTAEPMRGEDYFMTATPYRDAEIKKPEYYGGLEMAPMKQGYDYYDVSAPKQPGYGSVDLYPMEYGSVDLYPIQK